MLRLQNVLSEAEKKKIYQSAIKLLENLGVLCNHAETLEYFQKAGCKIGAEHSKPRGSRQVLFTEEIVQDALEKLPSEITLYPTAPGYQELPLLKGETYFETSGGDYVRDRHNHQLRPAVIQDVVIASRLTDASEHMDLNGTQIYWMYDLMATDEYEKYGLGGIYMPLMCLHSGKHASTVYFTSTDTEIYDDIRAWQICAGGEEAFREKPCGTLIISPTSPFFLEGRVEEGDPWGHADSLVLAAGAGVVLSLGFSGLLGATGPVTVPGLVAQCLAEFMGFNVAIQAVNPGNPVVMNDYSGTFDMNSGQKQEAWPAANLVHMCLTEMAHYINAPIDCLCASTSVETDAQLGWENMGSFLPQMLVGTDIICAASATSVDKVSDPLALLVGNEMAGYARHITKGVTFDDASIPVEMMIELGHAPLGGNFLETDHTFEYYRRELWQPSGVTNRLGRDAWMESGETSIRERTSALADDILANHEPDLPEARQKQLRELIAEILDREGVVGEEAKRVMEATYWQG